MNLQNFGSRLWYVYDPMPLGQSYGSTKKIVNPLLSKSHFIATYTRYPNYFIANFSLHTHVFTPL